MGGCGWKAVLGPDASQKPGPVWRVWSIVRQGVLALRKGEVLSRAVLVGIAEALENAPPGR